jgi:hypothetical protein
VDNSTLIFPSITSAGTIAGDNVTASSNITATGNVTADYITATGALTCASFAIGTKASVAVGRNT